MSYQNILLETTLKLKTKVIIFSSVSLFIGLAETLPTKLSLIGFDFIGNEKIIGWFLIVITGLLFINFLLMACLDIIKYFKSNLLQKNIEVLRGDKLNLTYKEIDNKYDNKKEVDELFTITAGSLKDETKNLEEKRRKLEINFDRVHFKFYNFIELIFNFVLPIILAIIGMAYLYCFLIQYNSCSC